MAAAGAAAAAMALAGTRRGDVNAGRLNDVMSDRHIAAGADRRCVGAVNGWTVPAMRVRTGAGVNGIDVRQSFAAATRIAAGMEIGAEAVQRIRRGPARRSRPAASPSSRPHASRREARPLPCRRDDGGRSARDTRSRRNRPGRTTPDRCNSRRAYPRRRGVVVAIVIAGVETRERVVIAERDPDIAVRFGPPAREPRSASAQRT